MARYAPEKIETALRTILDITAERSEWDSAQLVTAAIKIQQPASRMAGSGYRRQ